MLAIMAVQFRDLYNAWGGREGGGREGGGRERGGRGSVRGWGEYAVSIHAFNGGFVGLC
jgi:hypothetical protein